MKIVGTVVIAKLSKVSPNPWNPNHMDARERASLLHGFQTEGWLVSQSLLVWGKDNKGKVRNLIIDGEHRWTVAVDLDFAEGPMVFLNGLTEAKAKALTISINNKRGKFAHAPLVEVLRSIEHELGSDDLALELGFQSEDLLRLLAAPVPPGGAGDPPPPTSSDASRPAVVSNNPHTRTVPLFFDMLTHPKFTADVEAIGTKFKTKNVSETVLEALRRAGAKKR